MDARKVLGRKDISGGYFCGLGFTTEGSMSGGEEGGDLMTIEPTGEALGRSGSFRSLREVKECCLCGLCVTF